MKRYHLHVFYGDPAAVVEEMPGDEQNEGGQWYAAAEVDAEVARLNALLGALKTPADQGRAMTWRTGNKLGRTLYRDEVCVGIVDTPEIANEIVGALAEVERLRLIIEHDHVPMPGMPDVTVPRQMLEQGRVTLVAPDAEIERLRAELHDAHVERHEAESRECTLKAELAAANALLVDIKREGVTLELRKRLVEHCGIGNEQPGVPVTTLRGGTTLRERVKP